MWKGLGVRGGGKVGGEGGCRRRRGEELVEGGEGGKKVEELGAMFAHNLKKGIDIWVSTTNAHRKQRSEKSEKEEGIPWRDRKKKRGKERI